MSTTITIYLKNMAGDLRPLEVDPSCTEADLLTRLLQLDPVSYPRNRTSILSPGPLEHEGIVSIWVEAGPYVETWEEKGQERIRFVVPFAKDTLHIQRVFLLRTRVWFTARFASSESNKYTLPICATLYDAIHLIWPEVTPSDMQDISSFVEEYLSHESVQKGIIYHYEYSPKEPIQCECGTIVQRSSMKNHTQSIVHINHHLDH